MQLHLLSGSSNMLVWALPEHPSPFLGMLFFGVAPGDNALVLPWVLVTHICWPRWLQNYFQGQQVLWWWKTAPGLPPLWIYWASSWRIFTTWRFWLVVCSIARLAYLPLRWILSFGSYVWVKNKDLEGSFFGVIADPLQVKLSQVTSPTTTLSSLLFLYSPSKEKRILYEYSQWGISRRRQ